MSIFSRYVTYLKDNPNRYWFKRKLFGWGWTPATWQGWLVLVLYVVILLTIARKIDAESHSGSDALIGILIPFILLTAILLAITYATGERPKWQWGFPKDKDSMKR